MTREALTPLPCQGNAPQYFSANLSRVITLCAEGFLEGSLGLVKVKISQFVKIYIYIYSQWVLDCYWELKTSSPIQPYITN